MAGIGREEVADALATVGFILFVAELEPGIDLDAQICVITEQLFILERLAWLALLGVFGGKGLRADGCEILRRYLAPDRLKYRTTVQLEGSGPGCLDLGFSFAVECCVGACLHRWQLKRECVLSNAHAQP